MPEDERFEDYVELENYIEELQAGKVAHPPTDLPPEKARIYQMAALFRAGTDANAEPDPEFVERLKGQLLESKAQTPVRQPEATLTSDHTYDVPAGDAEIEQPTTPVRETSKLRFFSRRGLLTGGALAAASLVVGAGIEYEAQKSQTPKDADPGEAGKPYPPASKQRLQIAAGTPTTWYFVTALADLGNDALRFTSETITGYVIRTPNTSGDTASVIALSAACTHMGCLVQWKNTDRNFACPCHGASFGIQGAQLAANYAYKLPPLPSLNTKIEDGNVYVEVPR